MGEMKVDKPVGEQLAYIAGFFDGEGCVHIGGRRQNTSYNLEVSISNTDKDILLWIQSIYGGYIKDVKKVKEHHTQCYNWRIVSNQAAKFLESILPFLNIKKFQAGVAIAFQGLKGPCNYGAKQYPVLKDAEKLLYDALRKRV